eukprot:ctg_170.g145
MGERRERARNDRCRARFGRAGGAGDPVAPSPTASSPSMVVSETIIALTVAILGVRRTYRLVLRAERYGYRKTWLRNVLCRGVQPTGGGRCVFPACACHPHWFVKRVFRYGANAARWMREKRAAWSGGGGGGGGGGRGWWWVARVGWGGADARRRDRWARRVAGTFQSGERPEAILIEEHCKIRNGKM